MQKATKGSVKLFAEVYKFFEKQGGEIRIKNPRNPDNWLVLEFVLLGNAKNVSAASIGFYETGLEEENEPIGSHFTLLFEEDDKGDVKDIQILGYEQNTSLEAVYINEDDKVKCYDYTRNTERILVYADCLRKHFFESMCYIVEYAGFLKEHENVERRDKDMTFYIECDSPEELHNEIVEFYGH